MPAETPPHFEEGGEAMAHKNFTCLVCNDLYENPGACPDCGADLVRIEKAVDLLLEDYRDARVRLIEERGVELREVGE